MLFSLLKHYLNLYISDTALKVFRSLYCFTTSICHGVENYFPGLWGTGISDAIFLGIYFQNIKYTGGISLMRYYFQEVCCFWETLF